VQIGVGHTFFEVAPKEIITGIPLQWTWWPWPHHAGHPRQHSLYVGVHHPNGKIVSTCHTPWMTRIPSFCSFCRHHQFVMVLSTKIGLLSPRLLADCTPHGEFFRMEWCLHDCGFSVAQKLMFCFFISPRKWKWASSLKHRQCKAVEHCYTNCNKS